VFGCKAAGMNLYWERLVIIFENGSRVVVVVVVVGRSYFDGCHGIKM
jgi:hypothetical protein